MSSSGRKSFLLPQEIDHIVPKIYAHGLPGWNGLTGWFGLLDAPRETRASLSTGEDQTVEAGSRAAAMMDETRMVCLVLQEMPSKHW